jgi:ribosome-associated translation inhibitor RaiA
MNYIFVAPGLTKPTYDTLEEYAKKRFQKIERLIVKDANPEDTIRISVNKDGDEFVVTVELTNKENIIVKRNNRDLRRAIDIVSSELKSLLAKDKDKRIDLNRIKRGLSRFKDQLLRRGME